MTQGNTVAVAATEATASAQVEAKDLMRSFANLEVSFKDNQDHVMMRMKSEKTSALDEINQAGQSASKATTGKIFQELHYFKKFEFSRLKKCVHFSPYEQKMC